MITIILTFVGLLILCLLLFLVGAAILDDRPGFALIIFLLAIGSCGGSCGSCYSDTAQSTIIDQGTMTGVVNEIRTEGLFWKTTDASISLGFTKNGTGTVNTANSGVCLLDDNIRSQMEEVKRLGVPVEVSYVEYYTVPFWKCNYNKIATKVVILDQASQTQTTGNK